MVGVPCFRWWPHSCEGIGHDLEAHGARALDEDDVAGADELADLLRGLGRIPGVLSSVVAREVAHGKHFVDAEAPDELADGAVVLRRGRPQLGHVAEDRDLAALVLGEMLEGGPHRGRVRVVRVVDQQPAAGEW
jgi:hypothetical protein